MARRKGVLFALAATLVVLAGVLAGVVGCDKAVYYGPPAPEPPTPQPLSQPLLLLSITPRDGAEDVPADTAVEARFSRALAPSTVTAATFRLVDEASGDLVPAGITAVDEGSNEPPTLFRLVPDAALKVPHCRYRIEVTEDIAATDGIPLDLTLSPAATPCHFVTQGLPDIEPPRFFFYDVRAAPVSATAIRLWWFPALDNPDGTLPYRLVYALYQGETADGIEYERPVAVTLPGETEHVVGGLTPNTPYYFVVRPIDEAGNEDDNTVVVTANTWMAAEETELTVLYSADVFGTLEPCG